MNINHNPGGTYTLNKHQLKEIANMLPDIFADNMPREHWEIIASYGKTTNPFDQLMFDEDGTPTAEWYYVRNGYSVSRNNIYDTIEKYLSSLLDMVMDDYYNMYD